MFEHPFPRLERALDVPARRSGGTGLLCLVRPSPRGRSTLPTSRPDTRRRLERDKLRTSFQAAAICSRLARQALGRAAGDEVE